MPRARTSRRVEEIDPPRGVRAADDRRRRISADAGRVPDQAGVRLVVRHRHGSAGRSARVRRRTAVAGRSGRAGPRAERRPGLAPRTGVHRRRRAVDPVRPVAGHPPHARAARMVVPTVAVVGRHRAGRRSRRSPVDRHRARLALPGTRRAAHRRRARRGRPVLPRRSRNLGAAAPRRRRAADPRRRGRGRSLPVRERFPGAGRPGRMGDRPGARIHLVRPARCGLPAVARHPPGHLLVSVAQPRVASSWRRQR